MELLPSFWPHRAIALGAFVWFGKRGSLTRRPLLPLNAGTAEPVRVSPPEAVAYLLELAGQFAHWRQTRPHPHSPIPPELWAHAVALTTVIPPSRVAKQLRLRLADLKKQVVFQKWMWPLLCL